MKSFLRFFHEHRVFAILAITFVIVGTLTYAHSQAKLGAVSTASPPAGAQQRLNKDDELRLMNALVLIQQRQQEAATAQANLLAAQQFYRAEKGEVLPNYGYTSKTGDIVPKDEAGGTHLFASAVSPPAPEPVQKE